MKNKIFFLYIIIVFIISCNSDYENFIDKKTLVSDKDIIFPLDSLTSYSLTTVSLFKDTDNNKYFCYLNKEQNTLYIHNYETKQLQKKIKYQETGPEKTGALTSFLIVNFDTIFFVNEQRQIILSDTTAKVKRRFSTLDMDNRNFNIIPDIILTSTNIPLVYNSNKLYASGIIVGYSASDYKPIIQLNIKDDKFKQLYHYPLIKEYSKNEFVLLYPYYRYYNTYNEDRNIIAYSFPISDSLHITNHNDFDTVVYAASIYVKNINPDKKDNTFNNYSKIDASRDSYFNIIYDKYRKVYYRFARLAIDEDVVRKSSMKDLETRRLAVVILDEKFNKIGDVLIDSRNYDPFSCYISKTNGLCLLNTAKCLEDEDNLYFTSFKLTDIKQNESK